MSGLVSDIGGLFGGNSAKTDRNDQLASRTRLTNIFNYAMPEGQSSQGKGQAALGNADAYYRKLLSAGRTDTAQMAAPAVNAATDQADAARKQAATLGTSRGGGTASTNAEAGATTQKTIDDIINQNLVGEKAIGAQGETQIGSAELSNAMQLLGLSADDIQAILKDASGSRETSQNLHNQAWGTAGDAVKQAAGFAQALGV